MKMTAMQMTPQSKGPPLLCLRVLVPPARLISAAVWQTVQQRTVTAYGLLDDVITEITDIVPGLLDCRQRCLLCLNLRAQLILDLCRPGQTVDINTLQPHFVRMQTLSSLLDKEEVENAAEGMCGPNRFMSHIQRLIADPDYRQHFYQHVFPLKYGRNYCKAVESLVMKFLVALERLLVVPNLQQVAYMLGSAPSLLAECVELPLPRELKSLLEYQKNCTQPSNIDVLHFGDSVCTAPPPHSMETILVEEETLLKAHMLDDYMDTSGREQTVEFAATENASMGLDTKDKISGAVAADCVTVQPIAVKVHSQKDVVCNVQRMVPSHRLHVELNTCAVELHLGCNVEVHECTGHTAAQPSEEDMLPAMTTGEDEEEKLSVRTDGGSTSERQSSAGINMEKESAVKTVEHAPANEHLIWSHIGCPSNLGPSLTLTNEEAPPSTLTNEGAPTLPGLGIRPVRKNRGLKMKRFLTMKPKTESKATLVSKTCQTCGKTYSRSSDMKRHQRTHTGERPFQCPLCKKYFQFQYDLKRHNSSVGHVAGLQPGAESLQAPVDKTAKDLRQGYTSSAQPLTMSDPQGKAPHPRGTCQSNHQGTQSLRSHEEVCPIITRQECYSPGKEIPLATVLNNTEPNQAVLKDKKMMERLESTLLQGSGVDDEDERQVKQSQALRGSAPAAKGIKPILHMLIEAASSEGNFRTDKEPQPIEQTNSPLCGAAVKENPGAPLINTPPFVCPNCAVKLKSSGALRRHMVRACKVQKMPPTEADAAVQRYRTLKENKSRKCTGQTKEQEQSKFHCAECDMSFPDTARLVTHNLIHKPRPCTMCEETFNGFLEVNQHYIDVHHFHGPFPCAFCDRVYPGLKGLIRHERVHASGLPFQCPKCPKAFFYASGLKLHDRTHTKEAPFLCWDCGKGCRSNSAMRIHRLCCHSSAEDKRFSCEHCGKSYALKRSLDLHVAKLHAGVRYPCAQCGKLFRSASSLTRHDLTHTQERPFMCKECGKSFRSASELKIHVRYHTGERPFKCQECGKGFVQSYYLTAHMRMHSGEKPYQCPTCDKCFKSAGTLKRHRLTHTGEKPHKCTVCEMAFSRHELLKSHMRKLHTK